MTIDDEYSPYLRASSTGLPSVESTEETSPPSSHASGDELPNITNKASNYVLDLATYRDSTCRGMPVKTLTIDNFKAEYLPSGQVLSDVALATNQVVLMRGANEIPSGVSVPTEKNAVLFHRSKSDVDDVVELLDKSSFAIAALLLQDYPSKTSKKFPIFVLELSDMMMVGSMPKISTKIRIMDRYPLTKVTVHDRSFSPAGVEVAFGESGRDEYNKDAVDPLTSNVGFPHDETELYKNTAILNEELGGKMSYAEVLKQSSQAPASLERQSSGNLSFRLEDDDEDLVIPPPSERAKKKKGLFGRLVESAKAVVGIKSTPDLHLESKDKWKNCNDYYRKWLFHIDDVVNGKESLDFDTIAMELQYFLSRKNPSVTFWHLVFGARVVELLPDKSSNTHDLRCSVIAGLVRMWREDRSSVRPLLSGSAGLRGRFTPRIILRMFFKKTLESSATMNSVLGVIKYDEIAYILDLWYACGALESYFQQKIDWSLVRTSSSFPLEILSNILVYSEEKEVLSMCMLLCASLTACCDILTCNSNSSDLHLKPIASAWMGECAAASISNRTAEELNEACAMFVESVELLNFDSGKRVILRLVECGCLNDFASFERFSVLCKRMLLSHRFRVFFRKNLLQRLCRIFDQSRQILPLAEVNRFTSSEIGRLLLSDEKGLRSFVNYCAKNCRSSVVSFPDKLLFVDGLNRSSSIPVDDVRKLLRESIGSGAVRCDLIQQAFQVASHKADVFAEERDNFSSEDVVRSLLTREHAVELFRRPSDFLRVVCPSEEPGRLYICFIQQLKLFFVSERPSLKDFVFFCRHILANNPESVHMDIAQFVFEDVFGRWDPSSIFDLARANPELVKYLFQCLHCFYLRFPDLKESCSVVDRFTTCIGEVVEEWRLRYETDDVTYRELETATRIPEELWNQLASFSETSRLPSLESMKSKMDGFRRAIETVEVELLACLPECKKTLQEVLKGYHCRDSFLDRVSSDYGYLGFTNGHEANATLSKTLQQVSADATEASRYRAENDSLIHLCDYFLKNVSVLFRTIQSKQIACKETLDIFGLQKTIDSTMNTIKSLFDPETSCTQVDDAIKLISDSGKTLEGELKVLLNCPEELLSAKGIDHFRRISVMSRFAEPLAKFVEYCRAANFSVVEHDDKFHRLEAISGDLKTGTVPEDEVLFQLCDILAGESFEVPQTATFDQIVSILTGVLPVLRLVAAFQSNAQVRTLVQEMKWFGRDGVMRFRRQFENITNVLLGNSQSFEMTVLDSLLLSVQALSYLESCRNISSISLLTKQLEGNQDVVELCKTTNFDDIIQVQQNVSIIREWFTEGVDEASLFFGKYKAVTTTGLYCLVGITKPSSHIPEGALELSLNYSSSKDGVTSNHCLTGRDLAEFVQHVGLIQDDASKADVSVNHFLEQHQLGSKAALNIMTMRKMGQSVDISGFQCHVGDDEEAHVLLSSSQKELASHSAWLKNLRELYPVSLLFWTEELHQIYHAVVSYSCGEPTSIDEISALVSGRFTAGTELATRIDVLLKKGETSDSWLAFVSKFLQQLFRDVQHLSMAATFPLTAPSSAGFFLHTIFCEVERQNDFEFRLLQRIYKDRLPAPFEVFDCVLGCADEKLNIFLQRVAVFKRYKFVILNVELLEGAFLEKLMTFLSHRDVSSSGATLHCIQRSTSIMHTGPWVRHSEWDDDALGTCVSRNISWRDAIVDGTYIDFVRILWTEASGTGKTRFIARQLQIEYDNRESQTGKIVFHEKSTVASVTRDLLTKFKPGLVPCAVHFSFSYTPGRDSDTDWLEFVNHFFFCFLVLRSVHDPNNSKTFHLGERRWKIFVELPGENNLSGPAWLERHIPVLSFCGIFQETPSEFLVDEEARRVCMYLRALENGTINRKFQSRSKEIVFVLDKSGSMETELSPGRTALSVATDNAISIFDSHLHDGDLFGVLLFDNTVQTIVPTQVITGDRHKAELRQALDLVRWQRGGGTSMYSALQHTVNLVRSLHQANDTETWIVCLTDGATDNTHYHEARAAVRNSSPDTHVVVIGVNLQRNYEAQMRLLCNKYVTGSNPATKGFYVPALASEEGIRSAFSTVSGKIPVSQTFELDGNLSDEDCLRLIDKYKPTSVDPSDMLLLSFWVRFLYRRVKVMDENERFNYNETHEKLGSSLMETMLDEVKRLLDTNQRRDWLGTNHAQLIYDFTTDAPEFRLICTSPQTLSEEMKRGYEGLDLPGFFVPTEAHLRKRATLDRYLSQALGVPLKVADNKEGLLQCIDEEGFILTLDFTMKLLNIHERIACRLPCIVEGETGVSKTALTKMYSILRNSALKEQARLSTLKDLVEIDGCLDEEQFPRGDGSDPLERLDRALDLAAESTIAGETELSTKLHSLLKDKCYQRSCIFQSPPEAIVSDSNTTAVRSFLHWFARSELEPVFFEINVDSSLDENDFVSRFEEIQSTAQKLSASDSVVVVFLDEINTSCVMGLMKEIVIDRSIKGNNLADNVVLVAACNPSRDAVVPSGPNSREKDLGKEWASGHYHVSKLAPSMNKLKWAFGSLTHDQEKDFVYRRLECLRGEEIPPAMRRDMTEFIANAHQSMRRFACRNILKALESNQQDSVSRQSLEQEAMKRSCSVVSLRDIQRVFNLYDFFSSEFCANALKATLEENKLQRNALLLAISVVYFLRLDTNSRTDFLKEIGASSVVKTQGLVFEAVLNETMDKLLEHTDLPRGIALTRGLKENVFMTLVCSLSQTPLMIVGPPGSSKTLSVNMVAENANGVESSSELYREFAQLSMFHYQCSRQSTSREIASVFERATSRQEKVNQKAHRCVVFMDEAGLPEEEKESLKVLHYLLEGHMSAKAKVGFVAISNHVLDAAKSNRCVMLLREEPDAEEMLSITQGVLFDKRTDYVEFDDKPIKAAEFVETLCSSYALLVGEEGRFGHLRSFFGLRDYIYFLKAIRARSTAEALKLTVSSNAIVFAVERNFNGINRRELSQIALLFLEQLVGVTDSIVLSKTLIKTLRHPCQVVREAICSENACDDLATRSRYKLIIDCTEDDSIMRLLRVAGVVDISEKTLFKLSRMPEEKELEQLRLVSGVKFAASQGELAVLSQTETVNESFYDLFNQRFRSVRGRDGSVTLYANIAVDGVSRRSLIDKSFSCVVQIRESALSEVPAPFLNRFEKFRLDTGTVLDAGWSRLGGIAELAKRGRKILTEKVVSVMGKSGLFGLIESQTLDSIFIGMLPRGTVFGQSDFEVTLSSKYCRNLEEFFVNLLSEITSLAVSSEEVLEAINVALEVLPVDFADCLKEVVASENFDQDEVTRSLNLIISNKLGDQLSAGLSFILQTLITRKASWLLLQIATPEVIFARRHDLPQEIITSYFKQEHFSLRRLIGRLDACQSQTQSQLVVVYTRTDASIFRISGSSRGDQGGLSGSQEEDIMRKLVCDSGAAIVEHLYLLRSESMLRSSMISWIKRKDKRIYVLLVDMAMDDAVDRTNFVRMLAEQHLEMMLEKTFVLVLHYPPSTSLRGSCYPALFLGGWTHHFLDGIGQHEEYSLGSDELLKLVCCDEEESVELVTEDISENLLKVLPHVVSHVATKEVLYDGQASSQQAGLEQLPTSFGARQKFIASLMRKKVGEKTVGRILCSRFGKIWKERGLVKAMTRASDGLLKGTTQLSMTLFVHSSFLESFGAFVSLCVLEMNQMRNLDVLFRHTTSDEMAGLFGLILERLPVPPLEELVLQRARNSGLMALPSTRSQDFQDFPFFLFISSCLSEVVDTAIYKINTPTCLGQQSRSEMTSALSSYERSIEMLQAEEPEIDLFGTHPRSLVLEVIKYVRKSSGHLLDDYIKRFIVEKTGCLPADWLEVIQVWFKAQLVAEGLEEDLLAIQIVGSLYEEKLLSLASWSVLPGSSVIEDIFLVDQRQDKLQLAEEMLDSKCTHFVRILAHFERCVMSEDLPRSQWSVMFEAFLQHGYSLLVNGTNLGEEVLYRLRVLCFLHCLLRNNVSRNVEERALEMLYDRNARQVSAGAVAHISLPGLHKIIDENFGLEALDLLTGVFMAPPWTEIGHVYLKNDIMYVLDAVLDPVLSDQDEPTATLLRSIVLCPIETGEHLESPLNDIPSAALKLLCQRIQRSGDTLFSADGQRLSMHHFIPKWLTREKQDPIVGSNEDDAIGIFFRRYSHAFTDGLPSMTFDMTLQCLFRQTDYHDHDSNDTLLRFLSQVESEAQVDRDAVVRLSRVRKTSDRLESFQDTSISTMILDGLLVCLVAQVASELAHTGNSAAISGPYREYTDKIFAKLFELNGTRWDDFFFGTIIRIRGEGKLAELLGTGGALSDRGWCQAWVDGIPESVKTSKNELFVIERELAEAEEEEHRKAREFMLCPHCGRDFIVGERNCGMFYCGRDAHGMNGPTIGGARVQGVYGCGREFPLASARRYSPDQRMLGELRSERDALRARLHVHELGESLWNRAASFSTPVLGARAENRSPIGAIAPLFTSFLTEKAPESKLTSLMELLSKSKTYANQFRLLPDLVQLYLWVHKNLAFLITKEQAVSMKMKEMMTESRLLSRFDKAHVDYMLHLWQRLLNGMESILKDLQYKIFFDCEEIAVPFVSLAEAPIGVFLSEGGHPTDGNDFLFLLIREIIGRYNDLVGRLGELVGRTKMETSNSPTAIHPASLIPGSGGVAALHRVIVSSQEDLDLIADRAWDPDADDFKLDRLETELFSRVVALRHIPPEILNPMKYLRKKFIFRQDSLDAESTVLPEGSISLSKFGFYMANKHDLVLADEMLELLGSFGLLDGDTALQGILGDIFHTFDYNQLRSLLEGVRNVLQMLQTQKVSSIDDFSGALGTVMDLSHESVARECEIILQELKFPTLNSAQMQLLLSSKAENLFEIVRYVCSQISSEAHLFAELPLTMKEPLLPQESEFITEKLSEMQKIDGTQSTLDRLDGFIGGVLAFYEGEIRKAASKASSKSLIQFLRDDNPFCDDSDPVFAIVPSKVRLRNYVALRCHLHQVKLSLIHGSEQEDHTNSNGVNGGGVDLVDAGREMQAKTSLHAWLWDGDTEGDIEYRQMVSTGEATDGFWFERNFGPSRRSDPSLSNEMNASALRIQTWWRQHSAACNIQRLWRRRTTRGNDPPAAASESHSQDASAKRIQNWWRRVSQAFEEISISFSDASYYDAEMDCETSVADELAGKIDDVLLAVPESTSEPKSTCAPPDSSSKEDMARPQVVNHHRSSQNETMSWTTESIYVAGSHKSLYGSSEEEVLLRRWLNDHRLPQSLVEVLANAGARSVEDVIMIVNEAPELLDEMNLPPLDKLKLKKAAAS